MEEVSLKMPARLRDHEGSCLLLPRPFQTFQTLGLEARLLKLLAATFHLLAALSIADRWVCGPAERAPVSGDGDIAEPAVPTHVHIMHPE